MAYTDVSVTSNAHLGKPSSACGVTVGVMVGLQQFPGVCYVQEGHENTNMHDQAYLDT